MKILFNGIPKHAVSWLHKLTLTESNVHWIRERKLSSTEYAEELGCSPELVCKIWTGTRYGWCLNPDGTKYIPIINRGKHISNSKRRKNGCK